MRSTHRPAAPRVSSSRAGGGPRRVLRLGSALSGLAAVSVLLASCGSAGGSVPAQKDAVATRQLSGIGTVLVDNAGMTVYTPKQPEEANGEFKCTGSCLSFWFPVTVSSANPASSGLPGKLGTIQRPDDGKIQLTYNGRPLYTFRLDTAAGQAHGNNFADSFSGTSFTWEVVTATGAASGPGSPAPSPGYSYQAGY
jgi:predicted lipoprotein with Yx(FWY)xxD motif